MHSIFRKYWVFRFFRDVGEKEEREEERERVGGEVRRR